MPEYRARQVDAPALEWMNAEQAAAYLGLMVQEWNERVLLGVFPAGSPSNLRQDQWHWQTVQALSWLRPWLDQQYAERKRARKGKKEGDTPP